MLAENVFARALGFAVAAGVACAAFVACGSPPPAVAPATTTNAAAPEREPPGPVKHVVVVTIDGLVPDSYLNPAAHGLSVPTLRSLVERGASSDGALSVFPSVTYPSHTTIASGVVPARHGVFTNASFDPLDKNQDAWRWYAEDVTAPRERVQAHRIERER